jgi:hypothetical protein
MIAMYIIIGMSILAVAAYAWFIHAYQNGYSEQKTPIYNDGSSDYVPAKRVERERDRRRHDWQEHWYYYSHDLREHWYYDSSDIRSPFHHVDD